MKTHEELFENGSFEPIDANDMARPNIVTEDEPEIFDVRVEAIRMNLKVYNKIQSELIMRSSKDAENKEEAIGKWVDDFSPEYEAAFKDIVRKSLDRDEDFVEKFKEHPKQTIDEINTRLQQYHDLELKMIEHLDPYGKIPRVFKDWHKNFGRDLSNLLHQHPHVFERFLTAQKMSIEEMNEILHDIEDKLYFPSSVKL